MVDSVNNMDISKYFPMIGNPVFKRYALLVIFLLTPITAWAAEFSAQVDRSNIALNESFTLVLTYNKSTLSGTPDTSALKNNFSILNQSHRSITNVINGRLSVSTQWNFVLAPKNTGLLLIPSFEFDGAFSNAIEIKVSKAQQGSAAQGSDVFVETITDKKSVFVQEQLVVTTRLYTSIRILSLDVQPLQIDNTQIVKLDETQYQSSVNGKDYVVAEMTYAVFPQQSGELTIPSITWTTSTPNTRGYGMNAITRGAQKRMITEPLGIEVKPAAAQNTGMWLPAQDLVIEESWSGSTDNLTAGEPVTRRITVKGTGVMAIQLPAIDSKMPSGVRVYPDQPKTDEYVDKGTVKSELSQSFAVVADGPGTFTLPAVSINWWNTKTNQQETATLPETSIRVGGTTATPASTEAPKSDRQQEVEAVFDRVLGDQTTGSTPAPVETTSNPFWMWLSLALLILNLFLGVMLYRAKHNTAATNTENDSSKYRQRFNAKELTGAIDGQHVSALRQELINWGQYHFGTTQLTRLDQLTRHINSDEFTSIAETIEKSLYQKSERETFELSDDQIRYLKNLIGQKRTQTTTHSQQSDLKPLYPS